MVKARDSHHITMTTVDLAAKSVSFVLLRTNLDADSFFSIKLI